MIQRGALCLLLCSAVLVSALDINLKGTIKKSGGTPVAGAKVMTALFRFSNFSDLVSATTDNQGKFAINTTVVSTRNPSAPSVSLVQFLIKNNIVVFSPSLGAVSGRLDIYSANGKIYSSIPFKGLASGKQGIMLPRLMPGINLMRLEMNGNTFTQTLLSVGAGVYSQTGSSAVKTSDIASLGKITAVLDTLIVMKKEFIDAKVPLDSYNKQDIVDSLSTGVLKKLFQISNTMITGWKMRYSTVDSSFVLWSAADLNVDIDGGFERYTNRGMLQAADMTMIGPLNSEGNNFSLDQHSFIMDFGTEAKAKTMYDSTKGRYYSADAPLIPGYDNSVAFTSTGLGGLTAYAYYKQFYFELILSAYPDDANPVADAKKFLDYFKTKAQ
jgi:hypothetical protein